ncbi:MAG: hypothetical protein OEV28_08535 [Nitrospirota bacterium]|nr:hypothetical protein [Nitrospirota bacterium]
MESFPSLSIPPSVTPWDEGLAFDPTLSSEAEGGYRQTRPRCTHVPRLWHIGYIAMPSADKALLEAHELAVHVGADLFQWTNPLDSQTYNVRFKGGPLKFKMHDSALFWDVEFILEGV